MFVDASRCFSPLILTSASIFLGLRRLRHQRRKTEHCPQTRVPAITSWWNRFDHFEAALADIFVASGVLRASTSPTLRIHYGVPREVTLQQPRSRLFEAE